MTAPTIADLGAIRQMAADLDHARRCGHIMTAVWETGWAWRRSASVSCCVRCTARLAVYEGTPVAHRWGGCDLPCRGGGS